MLATRPLRTALSVTLLFLVVACSRQPAEESAAGAVAADSATMAESKSQAGVAAAAPAATPAEPDPARPEADQVTSSAATYSDAGRKFIRTAQAEFRVADVYRSALAIEDAVAAQGGFVERNEIQSTDQGSRRWPQGNGTVLELSEYVVRGTLTVRVPSDRAQTLLRSIVREMEFLDRRSFEATDAQFALLRQQQQFQRHQQAQQALGQVTAAGARAGEQVHAIEAQSGARSARDEALLGQREFEDRVAFATLELSMYQAPKLRRSERVDLDAAARDSGPGFVSRLGLAMAAGWRGLLDVLIALSSLWPLWLLALAALAALLGYGRMRRA